MLQQSVALRYRFRIAQGPSCFARVKQRRLLESWTLGSCMQPTRGMPIRHTGRCFTKNAF